MPGKDQNITRPKKGKPIEISVPKVSAFRTAIRKVAQPDKPKRGK